MSEMMQENKKIQNAGNGAKYYARLLALLLALVLAGLGIMAAIVIYVDPFFHYHAPLADFPYIVDDQLSQNPGMARNMTYNACIIGSSMTVNFDTDDFEDICGYDTIKLSYNGAYPKDDSNILEIIYDEDSLSRKTNDVEAVFFAMDIPVMSKDTGAVKYPRPEYLYDDNYLNDVKYLLNKDVYFQYILRPILLGKGSDLSEIYFSWWTPEYYNIKLVMHNYEEPQKVAEEVPYDALIPATKENLDVNILPFVKAHPETEFYFFFPPYSILYWHNIMQENILEATFTQYQYVADRLLGYDNVHLFYFQDMEEVTDLNNYADYSHYKPEINKYMVECFKSGEHEVKSSKEMEDELLKMRAIIDGFDFETLLSTDWG